MIIRILILIGLLVACSPQQGERRLGEGVLLITVDGWRRDHLGAFGAQFDTTPWLSQEASRAVFMTNAWAHDSDPVLSHASLLSGAESVFSIVPEVVLEDGTVIKPVYTLAMPNRLPRLARRFLAKGWATAAFLDNPRLGSLRGLETGFHDVTPFEGKNGGYGLEVTGGRLTAWLDALPQNQRWFAWVHVGDLPRIWSDDALPKDEAFLRGPEDDWVPPTGIRWPSFHSIAIQYQSDPPRTYGQGLAAYDTALAQLDASLGSFFKEVRERMHPEKTTIALTGSTGLSFGEGGTFYSSSGLAPEDFAVPLVLWPQKAAGIPVGRHDDGLMGLVDLAPTLLEIHGTDPPGPGGMTGISVAAHLRAGGGDAPRKSPAMRTEVFPWGRTGGAWGGELPVLLTNALMGGRGFVSDELFYMDAGSNPALLRALTGVPGRLPDAASWLFVEERATGKSWRAVRSDLATLPMGLPGTFHKQFGPKGTMGALLETSRRKLHEIDLHSPRSFAVGQPQDL